MSSVKKLLSNRLKELKDATPNTERVAELEAQKYEAWKVAGVVFNTERNEKMRDEADQARFDASAAYMQAASDHRRGMREIMALDSLVNSEAYLAKAVKDSAMVAAELSAAVGVLDSVESAIFEAEIRYAKDREAEADYAKIIALALLNGAEHPERPQNDSRLSGEVLSHLKKKFDEAEAALFDIHKRQHEAHEIEKFYAVKFSALELMEAMQSIASKVKAWQRLAAESGIHSFKTLEVEGMPGIRLSCDHAGN